MKRFFWIPFFFLALTAVTAVLAPLLLTIDPGAVAPGLAYAAPSASHWFGTDDLGRDVFTRLVYAGRISMSVGLVSVGISASIGIVAGMSAGYFGGIVDSIVMRLVDIFLAIPSFFLILAVIAFLDPSIYNIMIVIGITSWMGVARLIRAEVLRIRELDYVAAIRLAGAADLRVMALHLLPNALPPVLVAATLGVASAILIESGLSFLGLGVQPPTPSWGNMLMSGKDTIEFAWWMSVYPGLAILATVLSLNIVGESLREKFDPRRAQS